MNRQQKQLSCVLENADRLVFLLIYFTLPPPLFSTLFHFFLFIYQTHSPLLLEVTLPPAHQHAFTLHCILLRFLPPPLLSSPSFLCFSSPPIFFVAGCLFPFCGSDFLPQCVGSSCLCHHYLFKSLVILKSIPQNLPTGDRRCGMWNTHPPLMSELIRKWENSLIFFS